MNPRRASNLYSQHYLASDGQIYWSDTHQMAEYLDGYHAALDTRVGACVAGSEMISELYVPRAALPVFMEHVAADFQRHQTPVVYGTVRLIEQDYETLLSWARQPWACIVFNIHVEHTASGVAAARAASQRMIDRALEFAGSYYLTYHRWARPDQVLAAHPRLIEFLEQKMRFDPQERFQSDWYRHYRAVFRGYEAHVP
jgi:hypothetical protein